MPASHQPGNEAPGWWRRRGAGLLLALAVEALILLALLKLAWPDIPRFAGRAEKTFELINPSEDRSEKQAEATKQPEQAERRAAQPPAAARTPPPPPETTPSPTRLEDIPGFIKLSREEYRASDIGKMKSADPPAALADAGGGASGDSVPVGNAPNGEPLYQAEWFREPRQAELSPYLAKARTMPGGWGLIACQTAPRNRVENCQILGEAPAGSRMGYQVREAAWQFQVRPPRKGGKPLIGAWVRILISLRDG
ncbi:hypothetical protein [Sphingomonas sp.]|uniref:hypothetical protein n=1 Tax=Sphingomonas sp. TaxID=28214 RepID=UPI001DB0662B|nr:hypothetical protein [Sphingomonas sp.]MBX9796579.1 hypothetical protein [Sphingomonas sp.]